MAERGELKSRRHRIFYQVTLSRNNIKIYHNRICFWFYINVSNQQTEAKDGFYFEGDLRLKAAHAGQVACRSQGRRRETTNLPINHWILW